MPFAQSGRLDEQAEAEALAVIARDFGPRVAATMQKVNRLLLDSGLLGCGLILVGEQPEKTGTGLVAVRAAAVAQGPVLGSELRKIMSGSAVVLANRLAEVNAQLGVLEEAPTEGAPN